MLAVAMIVVLCAAQAPAPTAVRGGAYYGQSLPGANPEPFAANAAAALGLARAPVFSTDGTEMFWARSAGRFKSVLVTSRLLDGAWTAAAPLPFSTGDSFDHNPALSPDGRRIVFATNRPIEGKPATTLPGTDVPTSDLWMSERTAAGWSQPTPLGPAINTQADEDCPVLAADGTLYFSSSRPGPVASPGGIFHSKPAGRAYADPERLPVPVSDAGEMVSGIAPDGSYLLFYSMKRGEAGGEAGGLCVSFRQPDGAWGAPVRLAPALGGLAAFAASVTPDGRWLFLSTPVSTGSRVFWVSAALLDEARQAPDVPPSDKPGRYMLTRQVTIAEGKAASYPGVVAQMRQAADQAKTAPWWIAAGSLTGDLRRITSFTFYDKMAAFERDLLAIRSVESAAAQKDPGFAARSGEHVLEPRSSLAALRDDLSFNPDKVPPSAARYWSVTTMFLKAGHMSDFAERTKLEIELLKQARLDHHFLVYQVMVGVPSSGSVFYVMTPMKTLADMDADDSSQAAAVFTPEVRRRFETMNQSMISGIESDLLEVRPELSRPPASYVIANPTFWNPAPQR